jgi:hypothetical protein
MSDPMPDPMSHSDYSGGRRPSRFAAWRPFLTGVALGLAFLVALGSAMAQVHAGPTGATQRVHDGAAYLR